MPTRGHAAPPASVQSCAQVAHDSPGSQTPLPQQVAPSQQGPQSGAQVPHVSPWLHAPSPHVTLVPLVVVVVVALPPPPVGMDVVAPPVPPAPPLDVVELCEDPPPSPQPARAAREAARQATTPHLGDGTSEEGFAGRGGGVTRTIVEELRRGR